MRRIRHRVIGAAIALLGVSILAFGTTALVPGTPADVLLGSYATPEKVAELNRQFGLDEPLPVRYVYWLGHVVQGDLGNSTLSQESVVSVLGPALLVTLELSVLALLVAVSFAVPVGLLVGMYHDRWWARPVMLLVNIGVAVPGFWMGLLFILFFAVQLGWLPPGGYVAFREDPLGNINSMVLPVVSTALFVAPPLTRFIRATTVGILGEDYVMLARSKGVSASRLMLVHVARNAAVPAVTYLGVQLGQLISGAVIVEVIFALPGMGRLGLNAIMMRDYPVVQGVVLVVATAYIIANLVIDELYAVLDPRLRAAS